MMKYMIMAAVILTGSSLYAGECVDGKCATLRHRTVNVTRELISVPLTVTHRTVDVTRSSAKRTVSRLRNIVR